MYIRIYDYANISLYGLPCRPYSGTVLFRLLPWHGLQPSSTIAFGTSALHPWRWSQVARLYHGISYCPWTFSDGLPLYLSLPFFGSGSFAGTTSFTLVSGPDSGTVIFFPVRSSVFTDTGSGGSFLVLVSSFQLPFTSNHSWRSFHFSDKSDIHFPLQS